MIVYLMQSNLAANSVNDLFLNADQGASNARFINRPSKITMAIEANAVGIQMTVRAGSRVIVDRSILDAGGTTGVFPNVNEKAFTFFAAANEILSVELRETAGVATTDVMASVSIDPIA